MRPSWSTNWTGRPASTRRGVNWWRPGRRGATDWMSPSFNPPTRLLYVVMLEQCDIFTSSAKEPEPKKSFSGGGAGPKPNEVGQFFLRAIDPTTGERKWE